MTQPTSNGVDRYTGNGATSTFSYTFKILDDDDIEVVVINTSTRATTTLTKTTHYTVLASSVGDASGGSVTLISPYNNLSSTYKIVLRLKPALNNQSAFANGNVNGPALEAALDVMSQRIIEVAEDVSRSVKLPQDEAGTITLTNLGAATDRANKYLTFDSSGNVSATTTVDEGSLAVTATGEALVEAASAGAALTTLGVSAFVQTILDDAAAANVLTTLGVTATGQDILDSANAAAARTAIGLDAASGAITSLDIADAATAQIFQARLTMTSGDATIGGTGSTLYLTPYKGNKVAVYNGTRWKLMALTEISLALTATSGSVYDVWVYDNSGTLTLETTVWTNSTTRATALASQDGVYCKTGTLTRRYVGTFYASGTDQTADSYSSRYLWNYYNRIPRAMRRSVAIDAGWDYTTATIRQANNAATSQLNFVIGVNEDPITANLLVSSTNTNANVVRVAAFGYDSATAFATTGVMEQFATDNSSTAGANAVATHHGILTGYPGIGRHYISWNEYSAATGTTTWWDTAASIAPQQTGMWATVHG
jgi:hypothetical protein